MEVYKHSCPFCGQHVEYTDAYCGQQMTCPTCGKLITFPAIPPGGRRKQLRLKAKVEKKAGWNISWAAFVQFCQEFEHWNIVWAGVVPFLVIIGLVVGAGVLRKKAGDAPEMPSVPKVQVVPGAMERMTIIDRLDQQLQQRVEVIHQKQATLAAAQQQIKVLDARYRNHVLDRYGEQNRSREYAGASQVVQQAQTSLDMEKSAFQIELSKYQQAGGKVDYPSQIR